MEKSITVWCCIEFVYSLLPPPLSPLSLSPLSPLSLYPQEVEVLRVKASRVDKLQVELNSLRERLEDSSRHQTKLKVTNHPAVI